MIIDPTFSTNNPTYDGYLRDTGNNDLCDVGTLTLVDNSAIIATVYPISNSWDCSRGWFQWDISSIPNNMVITDVDFDYEQAGVIETPTCDIVQMVVDTITASNSDIFTDIGNGTQYVDGFACSSISENLSLDLGTSADTDLQNNLSIDRFGIGFRINNETATTNNPFASLASEDDVGAIPRPTLTVTYSSFLPSAPLNPVLNNMGTHTATADWDTPTDSDNITGYRVYINGAIFNNNTGTTDTTLPIIGLTSGTLQTLVVHAWNATGAGTNSSSVSNQTINTAPVLDKVNVYNNTAFELFYTINGTFNGIKINGEIPDNNGFTTLLSNSSSSASSYVLTNIESASDYNIKIYAHNQGGTSAVSNEITNATAITNAPILTSVSQTLLASTLLASWNEPTSGNATTYNIFKSITGCNSMVSAGNSSSTSYTLTGLNASSTYCVEVKSVNAYGSSSSSNQIIGLTIDSDVYVAPATTGGGGGSSGGDSSPDTGVVINGLLLNLSSKSFNLSLGEKRTYALNLIWDEIKESTLFVKSVSINSVGLDSLSVIPEVIPVDGKKIINGNGEIIFDINVPTEKCGTIQQTARCVNLKTYNIPVMVTVSDLIGTTYPDIPAVITVIINDKFPIGLWVIGVLSLSMIYPIYKIMKRGSKPNPIKQYKKALKASHKHEQKQAKHNQNIFKKIKKGY